MEPLYPSLSDAFEGDDLYAYLQSATQLAVAAMQNQLLTAADTPEETADGVLVFFEMAYRRIQSLVEEDDGDYLDEVEGNGENEPP